MFKKIFVFVFVLLAFSITSCKGARSFIKKFNRANLKTQADKKSYMLAYVMTESIKRHDTNLQKQAFLQGVTDSIQNKKSILSQKDLKTINQQFTNKNQKIKKPNNIKKSNMNSKTFLENNKTQAGVKVTNSGLQYKVLKEGQGTSPTAEDRVEVHYKGTLIDGTEFDSSYKRNQTTSFQLNAVIKGWTEGLQLMKEGAKYKFYIPSELAYGAREAGSIPANSTLIFEVELIQVN